MNTFVPTLPDNAPFTPEQRAYLNGFLAGLYSYAPVAGAAAAPQAQPLRPLTLLFGSQTGTCEGLAKKASKELSKSGFAPTIHDMADYTVDQLAKEELLLVIASTYGDGEPPDNAQPFWEALSASDAPQVSNLKYAVCALGDTNYAQFCQFGKDVDARLKALGGAPLTEREDCDVEYDEPYASWLSRVKTALAAEAPAPGAPLATGLEDTATEEEAGYTKDRPFLATLDVNRPLSGEGSNKEVRHYEISIAGSDITYQLGDALGVYATNAPEDVEAILKAGGWDGDENVSLKEESLPLREALTERLELGTIPKPLIDACAETLGTETFLTKLGWESIEASADYCQGRGAVDLILNIDGFPLTPQDFVSRLRKIQPRLYSIASSPRAHPESVHLTVSAVRYETHGRARLGLASTFLADRAPLGEPGLPVFIHNNPNFRPPASDTPLIMVGPGTGIAPFVGFLQDRATEASPGRSWLFFGDQHEATDYLYRHEIETALAEGTLERLSLAWSRDQKEKVYVQDRMREEGAELWDWLQAGAAFYVCGDASRMASDVDIALREIVAEHGGLSENEVNDFIKSLKSERRYCRDVY